MVEYSIRINLPDYVFQDPVIRAMSDATSDIMTWPNDILSFNVSDLHRVVLQDAYAQVNV